MVRKVVEVYECDVCGKQAERYTISYPDGYLVLDRCEKHDRTLSKLREEKGLWTAKNEQGKPRPGAFKVSSLEEIESQRRGQQST